MSRPVGTTKRFCLRSHDTELTGRRASNHRCRACFNEDRQSAPGWGTRLDASEIRILTTKAGATLAWMLHRGVSSHTANRAAERMFSSPTLSISAADEWCCALGTHLAIVYPELYREAVPA